MGSSKTFNDNSLFSDMEQSRLHRFLDGLESEPGANASLSNTNRPTPILLSSPYQLGTTADATPAPFFHNSIHINTLVLSDNNKPTKKKYPKRMTPYSPTSSSSTHTSSSDELKKTKKSSTKKMPHELLTDRQKKANHIASEQKRRANIRIGFEKLVDVVPTLSSGHRSESLILQKSVDHLRQLVDSKTKLKERARELQLMLGDIPDDDSSEGEDYDF
ncbi:hypothetical protein EDC94DRAFT_592942 [Helicostylum pulchrum]|nr:hypothetical protein EDC94DRAFT_592942 [Helicostylum pulchrum]